MSDLNVTSTSLTVAENSKATAIAIAAPTDVNSADSGLTVTVDELPTDGVVLLADEVTPVTLGETLTVTQLTGLTFRPTTNAANLSSLFAFTVSDPSGNTASGAATLAIAPSSWSNTLSAATATVPAAPPAGPRSDTSGDYDSVFGKALNIAVPSEARSPSVTAQVTELPTNGTVVLSDGGTPIRVGQNLTLTQLSSLRFKPNPGAIPQSSLFRWNEAAPGGTITSRSVALPFDPSSATPTVTSPQIAAATPDPTSAPIATATPDPTSAPTATATPDPISALTATATPDPTSAPIATPTLTSNTSLVATAAQPAGSNGDTPGSYNAVFGMPLDIDVPSEAPSLFAVQVTALPTNGTVVMPDGSTPVSVGQSLTPAQAAGLRLKPNGVAQSSQFDFKAVIPGRPSIPASVKLPFNSTTNSITLPTASIIAPDTSTITPNTTAAPGTASPALAMTPANPNPIVLENEKPGTPQSVWEIGPGGDSTKIQGFTTNMSTPVGATVQFKIDNQTSNGAYQIQVYRLGYYGGDGATLVTTINHSGSPVVQPNPLTDPTTGEVDAGNWSVTDSWAVPSTATSGVYVANVIDGSQVFQIPFVITNPSSTSDIVFQTSDETWQAYNGWGGDSLYGGDGPGTSTPPAGYGGGRALAVSYNRPIVTRDSIGTYAGPQDSLFGAEYAAIYWLEENGYDVSYISGLDTATNGSLLLNHKVFMDAGHDEYWTDSQVANVEAAENAGVNAVFLSGNEMFWQTRFSPSIDSSADPNRTLVSYKDTLNNQETDPSGKDTGTFEDPRLGSPPMPSNAVTGTMFQVDQTSINAPITIPYGETQLRFWRNTSVATTAPGQTGSLQPSLLGYEWDSSPDNPFEPGDLIDLSSTTVQDPTAYNTAYGEIDTSGTATNNLVEYRDPTSGALVFGAGTVFWSWGLSTQHDNSPSPFSSTTVDPNVQQATVNMLADMGVQPQTLQQSLALATQSSDHTPPTSTISSVSNTDPVEGQTVTVSGTATDAGGGVVAGVEVSTDGGKTWNPANSPVGSVSVNWTYSFAAPAPGAYTIESKAIDDSVNVETPSDGVSYTVTPSVALSLFGPSSAPATPDEADSNAVEVGVKFTSTTSGLITGIRFYKGSTNTGTHVGDLWTASGTLLASATFTNETASGWQQVNFSTPVSITAGTTYVASYHTNTGNYADTPYYFTTYDGQTAGSLNAPGDSLNGVLAYGASSTFPSTASATGDNFWVDVVFNDSGAKPPVLNVAASASYTAGGNATTLSSGSHRQRPGKRHPRLRNSVNYRRPGERRHAGSDDNRHQHRRQLQRLDRSAEPDWQRHIGALPAGARQRHLLIQQPKPDQLRGRPEPHDLVGGL